MKTSSGNTNNLSGKGKYKFIWCSLTSFSPSVSNRNTSSAYFWLNLKGEKPLLLGYFNWLQNNGVPLFSETVGNSNNKRKKDSMLYQGTGAFNCTYNTISSKARVSDETTQPLKNRHHERFSRNVVSVSRLWKGVIKYHANPRETKHQHKVLDWAVWSF